TPRALARPRMTTKLTRPNAEAMRARIPTGSAAHPLCVDNPVRNALAGDLPRRLTTFTGSARRLTGMDDGHSSVRRAYGATARGGDGARRRDRARGDRGYLVGRRTPRRVRVTARELGVSLGGRRECAAPRRRVRRVDPDRDTARGRPASRRCA